MKLIYATFAAAVMAAITAGEARADEPVSDPTGVSPYGKTVCEGRTWDYREYHWHPWEEEPVITLLAGYHFEGTKKVGDQEYAIFRDGDDKIVSLMREEAGKVYLYAPAPDEEVSVGYSLSILDYTDWDNPKPVTGEILVYDFTLEPGDLYICPCFDDYGNHDYADLKKFEITHVSDYEYQGMRYIIQNFEYILDPSFANLKVIEGAGNPEGMLPFPQIINVVAGLQKIYYNLLRVTDADGGILYENKELLADVATPIAAEEDSAVYDILGRRVTVPVAGNIYIRAGKKILWK